MKGVFDKKVGESNFADKKHAFPFFATPFRQALPFVHAQFPHKYYLNGNYIQFGNAGNVEPRPGLGWQGK